MVPDTLQDHIESRHAFPPLQLRWLGVAGLELHAGDQTLLIDPFLSRPSLGDTVRGRLAPDSGRIEATIPAASQVLVTHAHWDHLLDVPEILRQTGAVAYGSVNTCRLLAACGLPEDQVRPIEAGQRHQLGHFAVEVLSARHMWVPGFGAGDLEDPARPPRRARDYRLDECFSFHLRAGGLSLLDWSSQDPEPAPGQRPPQADLLLVKLAGSGSYFRRLISAVKPRLVVPVHWDDLFRPLGGPVQPVLRRSRWLGPWQRRVDPQRFEAWLEVLVPGVRVMVPEPLRPYDLAELVEGYSQW
jgi:L-ascorbate metabolism protein UlaG (beta-lactamase superfamily)